jgi:hypothetical protein
MAKAVTIKVKLVSSADTGFYYVAKKNSRTMTDKLVTSNSASTRSSRLRQLLMILNGALRAPFSFALRCPGRGAASFTMRRRGRTQDRHAEAMDPGSAALHAEVRHAAQHRGNAGCGRYRAATKRGSVGRSKANVTWMIPAASPTATPILQASV